MIAQHKELRCSNDRAIKLNQYQELLKEEKEYDSIILAGKSNDPVEVNKVLAAANQNMEAANRWTDNMWTLKKYLTSKKGMNGKEVRVLCSNSNNNSDSNNVPYNHIVLRGVSTMI